MSPTWSLFVFCNGTVNFLLSTMCHWPRTAIVPLSRASDTFVRFCRYSVCTNLAHMPSPPSYHLERRRSVRYPARLPVAIKLAHMSRPCVSAWTWNLSQHGVLLYSHDSIPEGSSVELTIDAAPKPFSLALHGEVLRVTPNTAGEFAIAVECDFPLNLFRPWP